MHLQRVANTTFLLQYSSTYTKRIFVTIKTVFHFKSTFIITSNLYKNISNLCILRNKMLSEIKVTVFHAKLPLLHTLTDVLYGNTQPQVFCTTIT